jgi:tetratricopeptide (TPR) repeat protein
MRRRLVLATLVTVLSGCASANGFRCQGAGGPPWRVLETDHFELVTDVPATQARDLVRELELVRATLVGFVFATPREVPGRVRVVALRTAEELWEFRPYPAAGFYTRLRGMPTIVFSTGSFNEQRPMLAHELAHLITSRVLLRQPRWLSEGLAEYLSTAGSQGEDKGMVGGPPWWFQRLKVPRGVSAELLAWDGTVRADDPDPSRLYRAAWATVHFLVNEEWRRFAELQQRLARAEDPASAWAAVFPEFDPATPGGPAALDAAVGRHVQYGRSGARVIHVAVKPAPVERPLPAAEVHALRLLLLPLAVEGEGDPRTAATAAKMKAEVAEALREDPAQPDALRLVARLERKEAEPLARRAVEAHPADATAWAFLASSLDGEARRGERIAALEKAAGLAPDRSDLLNDLAWTLLEDGRSGQALPIARTAMALAPWDAAVVDTYAAVVADLGRCPEALAAQRRAVELIPEDVPAEGRTEYLARLAEYQQRCGAPRVGSLAPRPATGGR